MIIRLKYHINKYTLTRGKYGTSWTQSGTTNSVKQWIFIAGN